MNTPDDAISTTRRDSTGFRVHVFGASGAGVSTLGVGLSRALSIPVIDNDEVYWEKTDPPFRQSTPPPVRRQRLRAFFDAHESWVNSGSMDSWGAVFIARFTHAIYLTAPAEVRIPRLRARSIERFGARVREGGDMCAHNREFIEWARHYDAGTEAGRSRPRHRAFIAKLGCPVLELDAAQDQSQVLAKALRWLETTPTRSPRG